MRSHKLKKHPFTLLEWMVILFLLSFVIVLTGVKVKGAYEEQRFLSETQQILSHLEMAQDLMMILDTDVHFHLVQYQNKQVAYWIDVDQPLIIKTKQDGKVKLEEDEEDGEIVKQDEAVQIDSGASKRWAQLIERRIPLQRVKGFQWEHFSGSQPTQSEEDPQIRHQTDVVFSLHHMSAGCLTLYDTDTENLSRQPEEKKREFAIHLPGYPCVIRHQQKPEQLRQMREEQMQESQWLRPQDKGQP